MYNKLHNSLVISKSVPILTIDDSSEFMPIQKSTEFLAATGITEFNLNGGSENAVILDVYALPSVSAIPLLSNSIL